MPLRKKHRKSCISAWAPRTWRLLRIDEAPARRALRPAAERPGATALPGLPNGLPNLDDPQLRQMLRGLMQPR